MHDVDPRRATTERQTTLLVRAQRRTSTTRAGSCTTVDLEEIVLGYLGRRSRRGRHHACARRWRHDLGQLAPAAHGDADRSRLLLVLIAAAARPDRARDQFGYDHDGLSACLSSPTRDCGETVELFASRFEQLVNLVGWFTLVPGLIGVLLAVPLVLELENGTYRLAWTQSVTRYRWLAIRLAGLWSQRPQRARAHAAHDLVAHPARPRPGATRERRLRLRGTRPHGLRALCQQ